MATWNELSPVQRLIALYARAQCLGMGRYQFVPGPLSEGEAITLLSTMRAAGEPEWRNSGYFDYLKGRVMKINVCDETPDFRLYDRDNGPGAGAAAIAEFER